MKNTCVALFALIVAAVPALAKNCPKDRPYWVCNKDGVCQCQDFVPTRSK